MRTAKEFYSEQSQKVFHRICEQFATYCIPREIDHDDYDRYGLNALCSENAPQPNPYVDSVSYR